ncbi:MAG: glycosyltransferase, partial [Candidatus Portnoybacteria bacterium]|nr:glycosyltransferase [Candidatus Portnoybacteria bacterium]
MKIWLGDKAHQTSGGMFRVYDGLYQFLPKHGITLVSDKKDADVLNPHIGLWGEFPDDKPIVLSSHGMMWQDVKWGRLGEKVNAECLSAYRRADVVTAPSHFVARSIARYTGANTVVAHHGIDSTKWIPADSQGYVLWNKARADSASNPNEMNELASLAQNTMFYSTYGNEADNVYVFGQIGPSDMLDMVSHAGVYLALSKESGGPCFGVLEALSCAVPVLSWNFGGTAEVIIHKETGYLAKPGDFDDLLAGLEYCLEHRDRLGTNGRQLVIDNYQWDNVVLDYIKAYDQALYGYNDIVSVIIPCYNLGKFLPYCLDSVLAQDYPQLEVVVVDDASTDNSWDIIQDYATKDSRIIPLRNTYNKHVSFSRNLAVKHATGQFILPLDADDRLYPKAVTTLVNHLKNNRSLDIVAGKLHIYHETALDGPYQQGGWPNNAELKLQLEGHNRLPYSSMYRRKVFDRVGGYRTRIKNGVEDADFWTRALGLGYKAEILDVYTLMYTHRDHSLGKTVSGSASWLSWFPWTITECPATTTAINSFSPPDVSIVIPVGPGHAHYLQACLDSIIAQTEQNWEVIVVNDTVEQLQVPGFVKLINYDGNRGVAYARNRGVDAALADRIIFVDADDILQPHAVSALLSAHDYAGGWVYGDWYIYSGQGKPEYSEAKNWNYNLILQQSLGPITGIYEKEHIQRVNGFTENIPGWEDWDFHLKLLHHGICGTRLKTSLITYNMHLGHRREENFRSKDNLLKYIEEKHYKVLKDKENMGCSSCGGKSTLTIKSTPQMAALDDVVLLEYQGNEAGRGRIASKTHKGTEYRFSANKRQIHVFKSDLDRFLSMRLPGSERPAFKLLSIPKEPPKITVVEEPLVSQDVPELPVPLDALELEEHVVDKLKKAGYDRITDLIRASEDRK